MPVLESITADVLPGDIFFVDPLVVQSRGDMRDRQSEVMDMAISFHIHGQRRPVECLQIGNDQLLVEHGCVRVAAARMICSGFNYVDPDTHKEVKVKNKRFKLKVVILNLGETIQGLIQSHGQTRVT